MGNISDDLAVELYGTMISWAQITIKELRKSIAAKKVGSSGDLYKSFKYNIEVGENGMPKKVTIGFLYHGKFVDMGVGNGVRLENVKGNRQTWLSKTQYEKRTAGYKPRRPKKWYSPTIYSQHQRAAELLAEKYAIELPARFEKLFSEK